MVEKKKTTKTTAKKPVRNTTKKTPVKVVKKPATKVVVKEVSAKKTESCTEKSCCKKGGKCMKILILVLLLINVVLGGLILCKKYTYEQEKLAEIGGKDNLEIYEEFSKNEQVVEQKSQLIDQYIESLAE